MREVKRCDSCGQYTDLDEMIRIYGGYGNTEEICKSCFTKRQFVEHKK